MTEGTLFIDRFEGELAVLLDASGASHLIARTLLPDGAREGDSVAVVLRVVESESDVGELRRALARGDDGGDLAL